MFRFRQTAHSTSVSYMKSLNLVDKNILKIYQFKKKSIYTVCQRSYANCLEFQRKHFQNSIKHFPCLSNASLDLEYKLKLFIDI